MIYRFGECRLDTERREIVCRGRVADLTPKAFDLLCVLIDRRPRVLSKAELLERIWPDTFVADVNLTVLIAEIRGVIGDSARDPKCLQTHHRVGYSFCGEVIELASRSAVPLAGPTPVLLIGRRRIVLPFGTSVVGRDASNDIVINDASVSRHHARIEVKAGVVEVVDLESKNGTRVGGRRIHEAATLTSGDEVRFGEIEATFAIEAAQDGSTATMDGSD